MTASNRNVQHGEQLRTNADQTSMREVARNAVETAEMIESLLSGRQSERARNLCGELRAFARQISSQDRASTRVAGSTAHPEHHPAQREQIDRRKATHATPVGSGGMGPLMNLGPHEEKAIDWGEDFFAPRRENE